ncbi:MAG: hypothetical protein FWG30_07715 [Eubacteriaceae bacterium]|nr:hypothetical protein [Eubacteriaceae bacterium]
MFEELDSLSNEDLVAVAHGIFAIWDDPKRAALLSTAYHLDSSLAAIAESFAGKYPARMNKHALFGYIRERTYKPMSPDSVRAGESFLHNMGNRRPKRRPRY